MEKFCKSCGLIKPIEEFSKDKYSKDGYKHQCKKCCSNYMKTYVHPDGEENKHKRSDYDKKRYVDKREEILEQKKDYYQKNKDKIVERKSEYRNSNREKVRASINKYQKANIDKIYKWRRDKYKHVIIWRSILYSTLKRMNTIKSKHTDQLLGYSAEELKIHLENQFTDDMNWDNYGEWQVDHIKPVSKFDSDTPVSIVCALDNLRPMWATTREINGKIYEGNQNKHNKIF